MRKFYFLAAVLWTIVITVACLVSMKNFEGISIGAEEGADKYVHSLFYVVLTSLWMFYGLKAFSVSRFKTRLYVFLGTVGFGVIIEICQGLFTTDRSTDFNDVIANTSGSLLAVLVFWLSDKIKKS